MPIFDTDISDIWWMKPEKSDLARIAGGAFTQSFNAAADRRQEQEQFNVSMLLKQQELDNERMRTTADATAKLTKQELDTQRTLGFTEIGQVVAKVGEYDGGWNSPEFGKNFWAAAAKHPEVMKDPGFRTITDNFDLALRAKYNSDLAAQRDQMRYDIEAENRKSRELISSEKNAAMLEAQELRAQHQVRDRLGDMGYRAFLGEVGAINSNKLIPESKKRMEIRRLYEQAEQGLYQPAKTGPAVEAPKAPSAPSAPTTPTAATEPGKVRVINPDGKAGFIPKEQLEEAQKQGYKPTE